MGRRLATFIFAVVQLAIALAPHASSYADASAHHPHLHAIGDQLEIAHDELACPSCSGVRLAADGSKPILGTNLVVLFVSPSRTRDTVTRFDFISATLSRAPPSAV